MKNYKNFKIQTFKEFMNDNGFNTVRIPSINNVFVMNSDGLRMDIAVTIDDACEMDDNEADALIEEKVIEAIDRYLEII